MLVPATFGSGINATILRGRRVPPISRNHPLALRIAGELGAARRERIEHRRAEEARLLGGRRHEADARDAFLVAQPFIVGEPEGAVADDRATGRAAELIALAFGLGRAKFLREEVVGVERVVAHELVDAAAQPCWCRT